MLLFSLFVVQGHSMEPTLLQGQTVLASSITFLFSKPKIGDTIVFKATDKVFIKRISKIDGERYFLLGDNKKDSFDSRKFGWINKRDILGKVIYKIKNP